MIDLYTFTAPNGYKASIMLEELALPYTTHVVNILNNEQFVPHFLEISPNNKIPAIIDSEGPDGQPISVFESAAILIYLARKTHSVLLPRDERAFTKTMEWLFFQMASVGPMLGQMGHFLRRQEKDAYAVGRFTGEVRRILGVMDRQLGKHHYLAGADYTIADIATYGWMYIANRLHFPVWSEWPSIERWYDEVSARPAVQRGIRVPAPVVVP